MRTEELEQPRRRVVRTGRDDGKEVAVDEFAAHHAQEIGPHYALTLREWRARFWSRIDEVRAQGFDERFIRMWDLYLAYCEAAFQEGHIGNVQLMFTKTRKGRLVMLEQGAREVMAATE